jgi:hypothetical protein
MEGKMKIYISGRITGDSNYREKFLDAGNRLKNAGHHPLSPVTPVSDCIDWQSAMRTAVCLMLKSEGVALLDDWSESKGAIIEASLALELGIPVKPIGEWLEGNNA